MQAITDAKRRVLQTAAEKLGKAERMGKDDTKMKQLLDNFKPLEQDLKSLLDMLKQAQQAEQKAAQAAMHLSQSMSAAFSTIPELAAATQQFAETMQRRSEVVQPSITYFTDSSALQPIEQFLQERIPHLKKRIAEHKNLETDLSAYSRSVKKITDKPDGGQSNQELPKLKEKLQRVEEQYSLVHDALLQELEDLEEEKLAVLRPVFVSQLVAEGERHRLVYHDLHSQAHAMKGKQMRTEIEDMVQQGGPEPELMLHRTTSRKTVTVPSFKGLFKSSNNNLPAQQQPAAPNKIASFREPPPPAEQQYAAPSKTASFREPPVTVEPPVTPTQAAAAIDIPSTPASSSSSSGQPTPPPPPAVAAPAAEMEKSETPVFTPPAPPVVVRFAPGVHCYATYDYTGTDEGDLSFKRGARVIMVEELSKGWWNGKLDDGTIGLFPETYVTTVNPNI